jgi:hypothetical protein
MESTVPVPAWNSVLDIMNGTFCRSLKSSSLEICGANPPTLDRDTGGLVGYIYSYKKHVNKQPDTLLLALRNTIGETEVKHGILAQYILRPQPKSKPVS